MENTEAYQNAKSRVEARMGFYVHLAVYAAVIVLLAIVNILTSPGALWIQWPMLGWGIAVAIHALRVFVLGSRFAVTDRMIEDELAKSRKTTRS